jgi:hypothetical protein
MVDITSGKGRKEAHLPKSLSGRLKDYALMAGAAGVGVMALAPGAQAGIITGTGFSTTLASAGCPPRGTCQNAVGTTFTINGIGELAFTDTYKSNPITHTQFASLVVSSANPRGAGVMTSFLAFGAAIGQADTFTSLTILAGRQWTKTNTTPTASSALAPWGPDIGKTGYLGFEFTNGATVDYGWLKLTITQNPTNHDLQGVIAGWAYNNMGQAIAAGDTGAAVEPGLPSLLLLSLGALGLGAWRRKKQTLKA